MSAPGREAQQFPATVGTYLLLLPLAQPRQASLGRFGSQDLQPGWYLYAGSGLGAGGLRARLRHHLHVAVRPHWHIDYLRYYLPVAAVWWTCSDQRWEHLWAQSLRQGRGCRYPVPGFGSSDCACASHLIFSPTYPSYRGFRQRLVRWAGKQLRIHWWQGQVTGESLC